ncbi:hypothetical protein VNO77_05642 [Canavalia gladiata]|uniref:Uncharacterized protein n=1 Tax=Canavalia gladiata TaxID=3824 RepID=A0AAN9REC0_CANGL
MRCIEDVEILYSATKRRENINIATWVDHLLFFSLLFWALSLVGCFCMTFLSNNFLYFSLLQILSLPAHLLVVSARESMARVRGDCAIIIPPSVFELRDRGRQYLALHRFYSCFFSFPPLGGGCVGRNTCSRFLRPIFHKCRESSSVVNLY